MENGNVQNMTRFLLQSALAAEQKGKRFDRLINKLRLDVEKLDEEFDRLKGEINNEFRKQIFELNNVIEVQREDDGLSTDWANDVLSQFFFENKYDIDACMTEFYKQIALIKEGGERG